MSEITIDLENAKEIAIEARINKLDEFMDNYLRILAENNHLKKLQLSDRICISELHEKIEVLEARLKRIKK